ETQAWNCRHETSWRNCCGSIGTILRRGRMAFAIAQTPTCCVGPWFGKIQGVARCTAWKNFLHLAAGPCRFVAEASGLQVLAAGARANTAARRRRSCLVSVLYPHCYHCSFV